MIFDTSLFEKEIYLVSQLWEKGHVKSVGQFLNLGMKRKELLMIIDICNAIPEDFKDERAGNKFQHVDLVTYDIELKVLGQKIKLSDIHSRKIYELLVKDLQKSYSMKIEDGESSFDYTDEEVSEIFVRPRHTTILSKHREFQYKLLHGVIYTKVQLLKFGFVGDNWCSFCQKEKETYIHVFLHCEKVKEIWKHVIAYYDLMEIRNLDWRDVFVGLSGNSVRVKFVNSVIIMLKYIIYKSRTTGTLPSFNKIQKTLLEYKDEEKKLATTRGKLGLHLLKWEHLN